MTDHGKGVGKDSAIGFLLKSFKKLYTLKIRFLTKKIIYSILSPTLIFALGEGNSGYLTSSSVKYSTAFCATTI